MSTTVGPNSQHGIATFNAGCKCDSCKAASRERSARYRRRMHLKRKQRPGDKKCAFCSCWFHPKGIQYHESRCEA